MQVSVICRLNQARSPFGQAIIETFFPEIRVKSFGVDAIWGTSTSEDVRDIAKTWNVSLVKEYSDQLAGQIKYVIESDLVILAENIMESKVLELGYRGKIHSFDRFIIENSFIPVDPIGLSKDKLEQELAKVCYCCVQAIRGCNKLDNAFPITVVIPATEADTEQAYSYAKLENAIDNGIIVDCDFRSPSGRRHFDVSEVFEYDLEVFEKNPTLLNYSKILTPAREYVSPEAKLLSKEWRMFLAMSSVKYPVYIVTAPRYSERRRLPDSYLAAIWSDKIVVIGS